MVAKRQPLPNQIVIYNPFPLGRFKDAPPVPPGERPYDFLYVGRLVSDFLVGIASTDPVTYIGVSALLASVAGLATYVPTQRATKVDPMVPLRYE